MFQFSLGPRRGADLTRRDPGLAFKARLKPLLRPPPASPDPWG